MHFPQHSMEVSGRFTPPPPLPRKESQYRLIGDWMDQKPVCEEEKNLCRESNLVSPAVPLRSLVAIITEIPLDI
jgi:hypothetical protein